MGGWHVVALVLYLKKGKENWCQLLNESNCYLTWGSTALRIFFSLVRFWQQPRMRICLPRPQLILSNSRLCLFCSRLLWSARLFGRSAQARCWGPCSGSGERRNAGWWHRTRPWRHYFFPRDSDCWTWGSPALFWPPSTSPRCSWVWSLSRRPARSALCF